MRDVWIYATDRTGAQPISAGLAELGFAPRHVVPGEQLAPSGRDGAAIRRPALAVVVSAPREPVATRLIERLRGAEELHGVPLLLTLEREHLRARDVLRSAEELLVQPFCLEELEARVIRATRDVGAVDDPNVVRAGSLELDMASYHVAVDGRTVGFTYMEYELLKFLMTHPNRVFTREALLARVWGYDYYGGARTVDVHVRRVRAKIGHEHAARIKTVRSVGYLFDLPTLPTGERHTDA